MRIVALADTHDEHKSVDLPEGDVLVHAGDYMYFGEESGNFLVWFVSQPFEHHLLVLGNHEKGQSERKVAALKTEIQGRGITLLDESTVDIEGVRFGSSPDRSIDVLVTHRPPEGILDTVDDTTPGLNVHAWDQDAMIKDGTPIQHRGSAAMKNLVRRADPVIHIFGHVHGCYGRVERNGVEYVNCSLAADSYEPVNEPQVIEL